MFLGLTSHLPFSAQSRQTRGGITRMNHYTVPPADSDQDSVGSDDDTDTDALVDGFGLPPQRLKLRSATDSFKAGEDNHRRFHGRSSAASLVDATRAFKQMHLLGMEGTLKRSGPSPPPEDSTRRAEFWCSPKVDQPE